MPTVNKNLSFEKQIEKIDEKMKKSDNSISTLQFINVLFVMGVWINSLLLGVYLTLSTISGEFKDIPVIWVILWAISSISTVFGYIKSVKNIAEIDFAILELRDDKNTLIKKMYSRDLKERYGATFVNERDHLVESSLYPGAFEIETSDGSIIYAHLSYVDGKLTITESIKAEKIVVEPLNKNNSENSNNEIKRFNLNEALGLKE